MVMRLVNICCQISQVSYFKGMRKFIQFGSLGTTNKTGFFPLYNCHIPIFTIW